MIRRDLSDFALWASLFAAKAQRGQQLPWSDAYALSAEERNCISTSLQQFELGENGQGRSLRAAATRYAQASGDWDYLAALDLFIREEQRHSAYLRTFMQAQGIPRATSHWVNDSFRWLRKRAGLELFVVVLVSAEIVAIPYYRSLSAATHSPLLQAICREILRDEADHLRFQGMALQKLRKDRPLALSLLVQVLQSVLMAGTCLVVWRSHHQVLRHGGFTPARFLRQCLRILQGLNRRSLKSRPGPKPSGEVD